MGIQTKLQEEQPTRMGLWARSGAQGLNNQDQKETYC